MNSAARTRQVGNKDVGLSEQAKKTSKDERKLEQGLEESMAGSDPVSVTQPTKAREPKK
jgi:hypothetical protein